MFWVGWLLFGLIVLWTVPAVISLAVKQLPPISENDPDGNHLALCASSAELPVLVSVIVPACNEGQQIENSLRSILRSERVRIELITINDRSTDDTGEIMDAIAASDPRVRVIHLHELPDEWLGKNHAMHVGAQHAAGDLILFTDGDVIYQPTAIASAVHHLRKHRLQHLCLFPRMLPGGLLENAAVAFFGMAYAIGMQLPLVRTRWPFSYAGVGAFNLIDAEAYRRFGGHKPIALDVLDDVKLGKLVKNSGGRQDFQSAPKLLSIRWQSSLWRVITGLEKNAFASLNYSIVTLALTTALFFVTMIFPYVAVVILPWPSSAGFLATVLLWHLVYGVAAVLAGGGFRLAPLFPIAASILAFAWWRSTWITLKQGGVRWRNSFYPLSKLRPGIYR